MCKYVSIITKKKLFLGESVYRVDNDVRAIQTEILTNGPVQAVLRVYGDLLTHKSGRDLI